ncbi:Isoleucine--tRNA ligase [bioreactor metagenome]|uniref:Isoleucine--tRNA ligase n=1 Tax=bioreactor metagenome TaxID=1076179 RepID=A0A645HTH2_9ZZZZ
MVRLIAPILTFTADEIWPYVPGVPEGSNIQVENMPKVKPEWKDDQLEEKWDRILALRAEVTKALEKARQDKLINHPLTAQVDLYVPDDLYQFLQGFSSLAEIFIVSAVKLHQPTETVPEDAAQAEEIEGLRIKVSPAKGEKCERCWMYHTEVGKDEAHPTLCPRCASVVETM